MDFSKLNEAAVSQKAFEENKGPEFIKAGRFVMMFKNAEAKTSRKHIPYIQLNFEIVKVLEGTEHTVGEMVMAQEHPSDYYMKNIAKWIHQILGIDYNDIDSDTGAAFVGGDITDIPVLVNALLEEYEKDGVHKSYLKLETSTLTQEEATAHDLDITSPLWG